MALRAEQLNCFCNDNAITGVRVSPFGYLRIVSIWSERNRCEAAGFDALARLPVRDHERARSTALGSSSHGKSILKCPELGRFGACRQP